MERRKGGDIKGKMNQPKLNKHEPEAISKGRVRSSLTFVHYEQGQNFHRANYDYNIGQSKCLEHFLFCL